MIKSINIYIGHTVTHVLTLRNLASLLLKLSKFTYRLYYIERKNKK